MKEEVRKRTEGSRSDHKSDRQRSAIPSFTLHCGVSQTFLAIKVAPIIGSAIAIGRYWVSVALSVIVFSFVPYRYTDGRLCHLEHVKFASEVLCEWLRCCSVCRWFVLGLRHGIARKKDSPAWDYFAVDEDLNFVVCQACNKKESAQR